jgi:lipoprotein-anchoring transpeptidase ErfK/SrfK
LQGGLGHTEGEVVQIALIRTSLVIVAAALVALVVMAITGLLGSDPVASPTQRATVKTPTATAGGTAAGGNTAAANGANPVSNAPTVSNDAPQIAVVQQRTGLYEAPDGKRIKTLASKTEWGNPRVVPVLEQQGDWLRVLVADLPNGQSGWIKKTGTQIGNDQYKITVSLSKRHITVTHRGRVVRTILAAVGEQGTPTPTGTFAVTDRINFTDQGSVYGCCALALSAHQPHTAPGWTGKDRIAIHATPTKNSIGAAATNGCMRVGDDNAAWLMNTVPMGTLVEIKA